MISDRDIADLCVGSYDAYTGPPVTWDFWEDGKTNNDVKYGVKIVSGLVVVIFPGSQSFTDWRRDLDTWSETPPVEHEALGPLHAGFYAGMEVTWQKLKARGGCHVFGGHSLGAARANIATGMAAIDGTMPVAKVLFGEPKAGFQQLADVTSKIPGRTYRNGGALFHDAVTDVPYYIPPFLFMHDRDFALINAEPPAFDSLGFFAWHHIPLYASKTPATLIAA